MTFEKWTEKAGFLLETSGNVLATQNTEKGGYFALDKYRAFFLEGQQIWSTGKMKTVPFEKLFDMCSDAEVATEVKRDKVDKKNILRLSVGEKSAIIQEKFSRVFPKNVVYSITGQAKAPVLVSIPEGSELKKIAVIMPYLCK